MFFMARTFDYAGYYETRLIIGLAAIAYALWRWRGGDRGFLIAFFSGVVFQGLMEWVLQNAGLRGHYTLGLFGIDLSGISANLLQGVLEGGPLSLMGFWVYRLFAHGHPSKREISHYLFALVGIFALAVVVSLAARGQPLTSIRPMSWRGDLLWDVILIAAITLPLIFRGFAGLRALFLFFCGVLIYAIVTFAPMQISLVRYIAVNAAGQPAELIDQVRWMAYSLVVEVAAGKLHYFAAPLVLGLFDRRVAVVPSKSPTTQVAPSQEPAPTVVFLHGWLMSPDIWINAMSAVPTGWKTMPLWQPAHGPEPAPTGDFTMKDWTDWMFAKADAVGAGKLILVGHSMGGMLALRAAVEHPERIAGLVIVSSTPASWSSDDVASWRQLTAVVTQDWSKDIANVAGSVLFAPDFVASHADYIATWTERVHGYDRAHMEGLISAIANRKDLCAEVATLNVPCLVLHGATDGAVPLSAGEQLHALLQSSSFVIMPAVGHCPPVEAPEAFTRELKPFFDSIEASRSAISHV